MPGSFGQTERWNSRMLGPIRYSTASRISGECADLVDPREQEMRLEVVAARHLLALATLESLQPLVPGRARVRERRRRPGRRSRRGRGCATCSGVSFLLVTWGISAPSSRRRRTAACRFRRTSRRSPGTAPPSPPPPAGRCGRWMVLLQEAGCRLRISLAQQRARPASACR